MGYIVNKMTSLSARGKPSHVAYADESQYNVGRYRGVALVTMPADQAVTVQQELQRLLRESDLTEFKWKQLNGAKQRFAAVKMLRCAVRAAVAGTARVDALTWDTWDSRHDLRGRDDIANLHRMYYHLFRNVLRERWPDDSTWALYPDRNTAMEWVRVAEFLGRASSRVEVSRDLFTTDGLGLVLRRDFRVLELVPRDSHEEPLVQLADLFVGMAVYSRTHYSRYELWQRCSGPQRPLFEEEGPASGRISSADRERCQVLAMLDALCKRRRLGVSLRTNRGLRTPGPKNPVNFWWYEPQSEADKAPVKRKP